MSNFGPQIKKKMFNLHFDCHFSHLNLFFSSFITKSTQLNHIIVNMFSGILLVTVNIYKTTDILYLNVIFKHKHIWVQKRYGQILICPTLTFPYSFFFHHIESLVLSFILLIL